LRATREEGIMGIFDDNSVHMPGSSRGRATGLRADAESYAASLGLTPGGPGWGDAIRDFILNGPASDGDPDETLLAASEGGPVFRRGPAGNGSAAGRPAPPRRRRASPAPPQLPQLSEQELEGIRRFIGIPPAQPRRDTSLGGLIREGQERTRNMFGTRREPGRPPQPARAAPTPPSPRDILRERASSGVESNSDTDRNPRSTAAGRYQFIGPTFRSYYRRIFPNSRETDSQINRRVTDGAIQERVMDAYLDDSERSLNDAEMPITPGRLYLLHVAGHPSGMRILRNPDRPIREYLTRDAMTDNPFGHDWTGHDLLRWADGHMNPGQRRR
jgi:hypothetical protein